jgi:hypothetical protein
MRKSTRYYLASLTLLAGLLVAVTAAAQPAEDAPTETTADAEAGAEEQHWLDRGYETIDTRAQNLADWFDEFFGHAREVPDAPESQVRIRPAYQWDEEDGSDWKLRVTGKLYLPKTSERLSVVFLGDQGSSDDDFYDPSIASDSSGGAGIQYQVRSETKSAAYLFAGIKAGPKGKLGARYRYTHPFLEVNRMRFSEEVFWVGGDGFGSLTRLDFDHLLSQRTLLRWANRAEIREDSEGWEWNTRLSWIRKLSDREAFRVFGFVRGESDPQILKSRGVGVGFRRRWLRDWLFVEFEPRYAWRKRRNEPNRDGVAQFEVRVEAVIGDL